MVKIISYYTPLYSEEVKKLITSLKKFNLDYYVKELWNLGNWEKNCIQKISFILEQIKNGPVLWTDADSIIQQYPTLIFNLNCDIASHKLNNIQYQTGTIFFNNTSKSISFLEQWRDYCNSKEYFKESQKESVKTADQFAFNMLLSKQHNLNVYNLPPEYNFIFDISKTIYKNVTPIIEHFQASRKYRTE